MPERRWTSTLPLIVVIMLMILSFATDSTRSQTPVQTFRDVDDLCLNCICQASTGCQPKDCATLEGQVFCGPYQISEAYWKDGGQPVKAGGGGAGNAFEECATDRKCSEDTVRRYLVKYARNCNQDTVLDCEDIARLHKAGPFACSTPELEVTPYWRAFVACYYDGRK